MAVVLVRCPLSSVTRDLLAAQLREMQPITRLLAASNCMAAARSLQAFTRCTPIEDTHWSHSPSTALQTTLGSQGVTVVLVEEQTLSDIQQLGERIAMKAFILEGRTAVVVLTAIERWEQLCWKGRVEAVRKSVLQAAQTQLQEELQRNIAAIVRLHNRLLEEFEVRSQRRIDVLQNKWQISFKKMQGFAQRLTTTQQGYLKAITQCKDETPPSVPNKTPVVLPRTLAARSQVSVESLSQDWQSRLQEMEWLLGERLSPEAVVVLTQLPEAENLNAAELVSKLLRSL